MAAAGWSYRAQFVSVRCRRPHLLTDDKAATHRVIGPRQQFAALTVDGGKVQTVGVKRQRLCQEVQMRPLVERDAPSPQQAQRSMIGGCAGVAPRSLRRRRWPALRLPVLAGPLCHCRGPCRSRPASRGSCTSTPVTRSSSPSPSSRRANSRAARIGPTVCELDGPIPILKRSKTLTAIGVPYPSIGNTAPELHVAASQHWRAAADPSLAGGQWRQRLQVGQHGGDIGVVELPQRVEGHDRDRRAVGALATANIAFSLSAVS